MNEEKPLQITETPETQNNGHRNSKGRPRKEKSTEFSTQPKSVISQLLSEMRARNCITLPIKDGPEEDITKDILEETSVYQTPVPSPCPGDEGLSDDFNGEHEIYPRKQHKKEENKINNTNILKIYSCDFHNCTYTSKILSNLTKHKRVHTSERPYLCDRCSFRSNFANSLKAHSRLHTGERPYHCQQCKYQCNSISNLKKHCLARHKNISNTYEVT